MLNIVLSGVLIAGGLPATQQSGEVRSDDAVVRWTRDALLIETEPARCRYDLSHGIRRTAWIDRRTGVDLLSGQAVDDFQLRLDGAEVGSAGEGWSCNGVRCERGPHGELEVEVALSYRNARVTRHYIVYPRLSLLRSWLEVTAVDGAVSVETPPVASLADLGRCSVLHWMTGAELTGDSWRLRTEELTDRPRVFDSYDPPDASRLVVPGDGIDAYVLCGGRQVWPTEGRAHSAHGGDVKQHSFELTVSAGDRIEFVVNRHGNMSFDTTEWDPEVRYSDGEAFRASAGFSKEQGTAGWGYRYLSDSGEYRDLVYDSAPGPFGERWRLKIGTIEPFVSATDMHPDPGGSAVRVFTAPRAGTVAVIGAIRNKGNGGPSGRGFRLGSQTYAPWFALLDPVSGQGAAVGFDCMGHWRAQVARDGEGARADVRLDGYARQVRPGEVVRTPYSFTVLFSNDLDAMSEEIYEWQYRYMWDYTREPWFPAVRMLGYWMKGTSWGAHGWVGGGPDLESTFRKVFRTADLMRETGGDTYHRDWGWWDRAGDWNGPDFRATGDYLRKYDMGQLIYAFMYTVDPESRVAKAHPDWLADAVTLDQSLPAVVDHEADVLDSFYKRWGPYQWRNDSTPISPRGGDDTVLLGQQQGFMEVLKQFLDDHPDCAFQGVNGGGMAINWEYLSYASGFQFTDGQAQDVACYYASHLFPPDKINDMPDIWDPATYEPGRWRALLCSNFDMTGDTFDPAKLEGLRLLIDIYHYLGDRGVAGRWVRVYHPRVEGDDPVMYLQRMSWDRQRGVIITKHTIQGAATVYPKGLVPGATYDVSFQESPDTVSGTGADLMRRGITLTDPAPGELIYLNLPDHPGNRLDRTPPSAPSGVIVRAGRNMGVPGVEVRWRPGTDETWLSHYLVLRDGDRIGVVAKGTFLFDHSAGADPAARYEVVAVDGSGNESTPAVCAQTSAARLSVVDDSDDSITYSSAWQRETGFAPAYRGTLASCDQAGAAAELRFTGSAVTVHSRLGAQGGLARVTVDGGEVAVVSCYAADEIPGWPLVEHDCGGAGEHVVRIEVLGQPDKRGSGSRVWLDGISVRP